MASKASTSKASTSKARTSKAAKKPWSFLAYIAADNNLSDYGLIDIQELCDAGTNKNVHAAVQIDTEGEHDGSIRYEISAPDFEGNSHRTVIARLAESDSGNPRVLKNFVSWGLKRYSADKRLLVVWNHGSGFRQPGRARRRDIAFDDFGTSLDMPEVTDALSRAGITPARKLSILGFDACLMNMLEVADHFSGHADFLVGSQQTEPGDGWPYNQVLSGMQGNPSALALAQHIVSRYIASYKRDGQANVTQSAIDLSKTGAAVKAYGSFGKALKATLPGSRQKVRNLRRIVQSYEYADYVDAVHLARLAKSLVTAAVSTATAAAVKAAVAANGKYGPSVQDSNGLSIWFPTSANQYEQYRAKYLQLKCNQGKNGWIDFLDAYFA